MDISVAKETLIRNFNGQILAKVYTDKKGNQEIRNFSGQVLGSYDKSTDTTRDFYGRHISSGNSLGALIPGKK